MQQGLNYTELLLRHLDRISIITTSLIESSKNIYSFERKINAFDLAVQTLLNIIPSEWKDKRFYDEVKDIEKAIKKDYALNTSESGTHISLKQTQWLLNEIIDLLNRKGVLYDKKTTIERGIE